MAADAVGPDPKSLWQEQEQEADPMTLEQIHAFVRRYDNRSLRVGVALAIALVAIGFVGDNAWNRVHDPIMTALFVGGELTACLLIYRMVFPRRDPAEPAGAYLRRRLQIRLAHLQGGWVLALAPLLPVIAYTGYVTLQRHGPTLVAKLGPLAIIVAGIAFTAVRARQRARKVKADLDELNGLLG